MATALAIFSLVLIGMSLYGVIRPRELVALVRQFVVSLGIWPASGIRVVLAALLWFTSPGSQTPLVFKVLAALTLLAAVVIPLIGKDRILKLFEWFESWPSLVVQIQSLGGLALGAFILWSIWPAIPLL